MDILHAFGSFVDVPSAIFGQEVMTAQRDRTSETSSVASVQIRDVSRVRTQDSA